MRRHALQWEAGPPPPAREGGLVVGIGMNAVLVRLAVDPDGVVAPPRPKARPGGAQLQVEVLGEAPDDRTRRCGRMRLPR